MKPQSTLPPYRAPERSQKGWFLATDPKHYSSPALVNPKMEIVVKTETEADYEQITRVHTAAFNGDSEARLVEKL